MAKQTKDVSFTVRDIKGIVKKSKGSVSIESIMRTFADSKDEVSKDRLLDNVNQFIQDRQASSLDYTKEQQENLNFIKKFGEVVEQESGSTGIKKLIGNLI